MGKQQSMRQFEQNSTADEGADRLGRLAEVLGLEIAPEQLAAFAKQLRVLETLEIDELQDCAPILKMDADWHD